MKDLGYINRMEKVSLSGGEQVVVLVHVLVWGGGCGVGVDRSLVLEDWWRD